MPLPVDRTCKIFLTDDDHSFIPRHFARYSDNLKLLTSWQILSTYLLCLWITSFNPLKFIGTTTFNIKWSCILSSVLKFLVGSTKYTMKVRPNSINWAAIAMDRSESVIQVNYRHNGIKFLGDKFLKTQNWNESITIYFHKVWMMLRYS